jgi:hypothetical protein
MAGTGKRGDDIPAVQASRAHRWHLQDLKRDAYAEPLRSVSSSYAQAYADEGDSGGCQHPAGCNPN